MVTIIGGDPVIGAALETLLRSAGYRTWFLPESMVVELKELLADSRLLIVVPPLSPRHQLALSDVVLSSASEMPILELLPVGGVGQGFRRSHIVLWPCSLEELKQAIDAVMRAQR